MTPEQKNNTSWLEEISELIRKKQEENQALKKVQKSLNSIGQPKVNKGESTTDEEKHNDKISEDQSVNN